MRSYKFKCLFKSISWTHMYACMYVTESKGKGSTMHIHTVCKKFRREKFCRLVRYEKFGRKSLVAIFKLILVQGVVKNLEEKFGSNLQIDTSTGCCKKFGGKLIIAKLFTVSMKLPLQSFLRIRHMHVPQFYSVHRKALYECINDCEHYRSFPILVIIIILKSVMTICMCVQYTLCCLACMHIFT